MSLKVDGLSVVRGGKHLLRNVSFEARSGEVIAVLGANGAGKSTMLKTLCGEIRSSEGEISFDGKGIDSWKIDELSKIRGVLPQSFSLNFPFRVREVTLLGRTPHVVFSESRRDHKIVADALKMVEAAVLAERSYPTLSGGERQRVQLARVLAQIWEKPLCGSRYLLLDEPTSSLDLAHQHLTLQTARKFARADTVVITVLHDLNLAAQYADRILVLRDGKRFAFGEPKEILTPETIKESFGIEVYVTDHARIDNVPLIVPVGRDLENEVALSVSA
ncbi:MAG: heme ABC transporter ATP-binding protein [Pyrinomonadaceae bacterium]